LSRWTVDKERAPLAHDGDVAMCGTRVALLIGPHDHNLEVTGPRTTEVEHPVGGGYWMGDGHGFRPQALSEAGLNSAPDHWTLTKPGLPTGVGVQSAP
jgi:hypothetical protein